MLKSCYQDLSPEERRYWFPEALFDEIDSGYSADIACCDSCYDEFISLWPYASSANNSEFERAGISLDLIYENSRLSEIFLKEEFDEFIKDINCPRCENQIGPNIWPYNFPFSVDSSFETTIEELKRFAELTPFLMLNHEFAKKVFQNINTIGKSIAPSALHNLYRARVKDGKVLEELSFFDFPPRHLVKEGRFNHAGNPVLYLGSDQDTCFEEVRRKACIIAELQFETSLTILDLINPWDAHPDFADELSALTYSVLMSAKQPDDGWDKPAYVFTRFIADCARSSGIQAIKYPSTHIVRDNYNLVIIDPKIQLKNIAKVNRYIYLEEK